MTAMDEISNPDKLYDWLKDKPGSWNAAMSLRIALRVLPITLSPSQLPDPVATHDATLVLFRALSLSWAAQNVPAVEDGTDAAALTFLAADAVEGYAAAIVDPDTAHATRAIAYAANTAADAHISKPFNIPEFAANTAISARRSANSASAASADILTADAEFLNDNSDSPDAALLLLSRPLWLGKMPRSINSIWQWVGRMLRNSKEGGAIWADWYERRLRGDATGFALSVSKDMEVQRRLIAADDRWWRREPALVNADIAAWLDELSPRVTDPMRLLEPAPDPLVTLLAEPQSNAAPHFTEDGDGRVAIDPHARSDELLTDSRAAERHAAARRRAAAAAERLKGHNQADYLSGLAQDVHTALGDTIAGGDLAETLLLANQIRRADQQHATAGASEDIQPLPGDAARIVAVLVEALNLHIGQQPVLAAMDLAALGPDAVIDLASPEDARQLVADRDAAQGLAPRTRDYIDVAAGLAPAAPNPADRQSRRLSGLMANLGRYLIEKISEHRLKLLTLIGGAAAGATMAFVGVAGAVPVLGGAAYLLGNMKKHPDVWMRIAGPAPASQANMLMVLDFLDKYWPSETGKGDTAKNP